MADLLGKNTRKIKGIKFKTATNKEYFLQLEKGGWRGWLFYKNNNSWVSLKQASIEDLLNILENNILMDYITV